jgi:UDP-glucose 6-dehydrogenase
MTEDLNYILTDSLIITKKFRSPNEFSLYIEGRVAAQTISYMEAIIQYCEEVDIDIESISKLINQSLKDKVQIEAEDGNYFKKRGKLPL